MVVAVDADTSGKLLGKEKPLDVEAGSAIEADVVVGAVALDGKPNKLGVMDEVVVVTADDDGAIDRVGALVPKENCGSLSDATIEETVVVAASGALPNDANVIVVGTFDW